MLLNLIKHQRYDVDKIYYHIKNPFESKYQLVINRREKAEIKQEKNSREFINYSKTIDDVYENLKDHNLTKIKSVKSVWWYDSRYGSL